MKEVKHYDSLVERYSSVDEIVVSFYEDIRSSIRRKAENGRSKYATYLSINPNLETPRIYNDISCKKHLSMVAKLRTSSHNLRIEMGRRVGLNRDLREEGVCVIGMLVLLYGILNFYFNLD